LRNRRRSSDGRSDLLMMESAHGRQGSTLNRSSRP
jgi:hypothetical protein